MCAPVSMPAREQALVYVSCSTIPYWTRTVASPALLACICIAANRETGSAFHGATTGQQLFGSAAFKCYIVVTHKCPAARTNHDMQVSVGKQLKSILDMGDNTKIGFSVFVSTMQSDWRYDSLGQP